MESYNPKFEHYHDTGEHAISRNLEDYKKMAFKEDSNYWLKTKPEKMTPDDPQQWSLRHLHTLEHFIPEKTDDKIIAKKDSSIQYEWDWKEKNIFGGLKSFFQNDSTILDLGSGKGIAVQEINKEFRDKNIKCIGVDYRYTEEQPSEEKNLVAGDFKNLPFLNNAFNRILGIESFPTWLPKEEKLIDNYIEEITRVCAVDSIWRGTLPQYDIEDEIIIPTNVLIEKFVKAGWEVIITNNSFIAKLIYKD